MAQEQDGIKMADKAIKDSKAALEKAVKFNGPVKPMPKPAAPAAKPAAPSSGLLTTTGHDQAPALKAKTDMLDELKAATPKMHKGGEVMEDGLKNLKKGEVVIPKDKADEGKKIMGIVKKAKGPMAKAAEEMDEPKHESKKESKKEDKKVEKKESKPKPHNFHRAEHEFHSNGSITTKLHHKPPKPSADGKMEPTQEPTTFASPDYASMASAMQEHVGGGPAGAEPGEP